MGGECLILTQVPYINGPYCHLYSFGDTHIGSVDCNEKLLLKDITAVSQDPFARVILNGDILQCDYKDSVGDVYNQKYPPSQQEEMAEQWFTPIKDKIIGVLDGNHDGGRTKEDNRPLRRISRHLGVPYLQDEGLFKFSIGARPTNGKPFVYTAYVVHGWSSGRTRGAKANVLDNLDKVVLADIYIVNHTHAIMSFPGAVYVPDLRNNKVEKMERHFINAGSWQERGHYPQRRAFAPQVLGTPQIIISGTEKRVNVLT